MKNDTDEIIGNFVNKRLTEKIKEVLTTNKNAIVLDFNDIDQFSPELGDQLLKKPEETLDTIKYFVNETSIPHKNLEIEIRIKNLPNNTQMLVREIRSKHIGLLIQVQGLIKTAASVRPVAASIDFECQSCGHLTKVEQKEMTQRAPSVCTNCGKKGRFKVARKYLVDTQRIMLEEAPEDLEGGEQPEHINIILKKDLVDPKFERNIIPGNKVVVSGIVNESAVYYPSGKKSNTSDIFILASYVEAVEQGYEDILVTKEEELAIRELANDKMIYTKFKSSIAPNIYGHDNIKEAIVMQLFGGVRKAASSGNSVIRGDIHILLVGDPGTSKSSLLKYVTGIAPKARYVVGMGSSAAGLTATIIKDDATRSYILEAGALPLTNKGLLMIDELDKMNKDDRVAMHEALEQQSYHPSSEILLADGKKIILGEFIDTLMDKNKEHLIKGKDCEILPLTDKNAPTLLTTDFKTVYSVKVDRVSRHYAPDKFIKITYSNGRSIMVTPEHPVFVLDENNSVNILPAEEVTEGLLVPAASNYPLENKHIELKIPESKYKHAKQVDFPHILNREMGRLLGYIVSEGHSYYSTKNRVAEIMVSNTNKGIIDDTIKIIKRSFNITPLVSIRKATDKNKATKDLFTVRAVSRSIYDFFELNFPEVMKLSDKKRLPQSVMGADKDCRVQMLLGAFRGDGFYDSERMGYVTNSIGLAKDYSDVLLSIGIFSYITKTHDYFSKKEEKRKNAYKVVISGFDSINTFYELIGKHDFRRLKIRYLLKRSKNRPNDRNRIPTGVIIKLKTILRDFRLDDGYFGPIINANGKTHRKVAASYLDKVESYISSLCTKLSVDPKVVRHAFKLPISAIAANMNISASDLLYREKSHPDIVYQYVKPAALSKLKNALETIKYLKLALNPQFRALEIKKVEKVPNEDVKFVYDVTVEPNHTFISDGIVLHNTISISKANIHATLSAQTSVLAAANPKLGRFNPFDVISSQIELPPTLINRFDLIFILKDRPNKETDTLIAQRILEANRDINKNKPEIPPNIMKKYIAYAKQNIKPKLSMEAMKVIEEFYLKLRSQYSTEGEEVKPIPISARQLEAIVRLTEASAKVRLSDYATIEDAKRAVDLMMSYLGDVGIDSSTGELDIDRVITGIPSSQRNTVLTVKALIKSEVDLMPMGGSVSMAKIYESAEKAGIDRDRVDSAISVLKREGEVFEPKPSFIKLL